MHCELSTEIPAPPELVWRIAQDPALRPQWDHRVAAYEVDGAPGAGARITITLRMGLLRPKALGEYLRFVPHRQSIVRIGPADSKLVATGAGSWTFEPIPGGTRYTTRFTLNEAELYPWIPRRLYLWAVEMDTARSLRRLRRLVLAHRQ